MAQTAGTGHHHAALLKHPPLTAHAPSLGFAAFVWEVPGRNLSSGLGWIAVPGLTPEPDAGPGLADVKVVMILLPGRCPPSSQHLITIPH